MFPSIFHISIFDCLWNLGLLLFFASLFLLKLLHFPTNDQWFMLEQSIISLLFLTLCLWIPLLSAPPLFSFIASPCLDHSFPTLHSGCGLTSCSGRGQLHGKGKILTLILISYSNRQVDVNISYKTSSIRYDTLMTSVPQSPNVVKGNWLNGWESNLRMWTQSFCVLYPPNVWQQA